MLSTFPSYLIGGIGCPELYCLLAPWESDLAHVRSWHEVHGQYAVCYRLSRFFSYCNMIICAASVYSAGFTYLTLRILERVIDGCFIYTSATRTRDLNAASRFYPNAMVTFGCLSYSRMVPRQLSVSYVVLMVSFWNSLTITWR